MILFQKTFTFVYLTTKKSSKCFDQGLGVRKTFLLSSHTLGIKFNVLSKTKNYKSVSRFSSKCLS